MGKSVNQVTLLGNLTKDPELKYTPQGTAVINFGIATNRSYKDKTTQEWKDIPEFHNVVFWGKPAEVISQYCKKGNKLFVQGRLQTRNWDDKNTGVKRYMTEIVGSEFTLLTPKPQQPQSQPREATSQQAEEIFNPPVQPAPAPAPVPAPAQPVMPDKVVEEVSVESFENWMDKEEAKREVIH